MLKNVFKVLRMMFLFAILKRKMLSEQHDEPSSKMTARKMRLSFISFREAGSVDSSHFLMPFLYVAHCHLVKEDVFSVLSLSAEVIGLTAKDKCYITLCISHLNTGAIYYETGEVITKIIWINAVRINHQRYWTQWGLRICL